MKIPLILASDFSGLIPALVGIPVIVAGIALLSFLPAKRGHWLAPVLAVPPFLLGLLCTVSLFTEGAMLMLWFIFPLPMLAGGAALILWIRGRAAKKKRIQSRHRDADSRPSSGDSSAPESASSPGARG